MTTTVSLRDFVIAADKEIERMFLHKGDIHMMFHVVDGDGNEGVLSAPPVFSKNAAMAVMRSTFAQMKARRYLMVHEAWMVDAHGDGVEAARAHAESGKSLELAPGRREVVMYSAEDEKEGMLIALREIIRPATGNARLGPLEFLPAEGGIASGRMMGLLPRSGSLQ